MINREDGQPVSETESGPAAVQPVSRSTTALAVALGLSVVAVYGQTLVGLWNDWLNDPNYAHGILAIPAAAWLVWRRRVDYERSRWRPSSAGAVLAGASLFTYLLGQTAFEFFLTRISLVGLIAGVIVYLMGWKQLRASALPLTLLVLSIPLPALIFNQITFPMQLIASRFGVAMLDVTQIPVVREGNVILLEQVTLEVAEACSGIRSLISLTTLALVYGAIGNQPPAARIMVLLAVLPVVIVANGLRVAGAGAVAHAYGPAAASGFLHSFSGWLFFGSAVLMLIAVERTASALPWGTSTRAEGRA
jgi:exosortase